MSRGRCGREIARLRRLAAVVRGKRREEGEGGSGGGEGRVEAEGGRGGGKGTEGKGRRGRGGGRGKGRGGGRGELPVNFTLIPPETFHKLWVIFVYGSNLVGAFQFMS